MQFININRIKEYFYKRQNRILVILSLSVLFLVVKEIHFAEEHGIEYTTEAITQMIVNRGHSLESIRKE